MLTLAPRPASAAVDDADVDRAIRKMKKYFFDRQQDDGSWPDYHGERNHGGVTALVTLSLLVSGESMQHPQIVKALKYLRKTEITGTYAMSLRAHVWSYLPDGFLPLLKSDAEWLQGASAKHELGLFDYTANSSRRVDHSVAQYGLLGLWQASKRGIHVPGQFWQQINGHFTSAQFPTGGWGYNLDPGSERESMTLAGLTAMLVAQQELYRDARGANLRIQKVIDKGLEWMDKRFTSGASYYSLYGLERVALASGTRYFNGRDWFLAGANKIVGTVQKSGHLSGGHGGPDVATAFGLMFLARGRVPVWVNKLEVPGQRWNNRPNDLYFLTHYLSNLREGEINWQSVNINHKPEDWLIAPIAYLSGTAAIELTDPQKANLKRFIDMGGLLWCNAENGSKAFETSIRKLSAELYPRLKMQALSPEHRLYDSLHTVSNRGNQVIFSVSNGARDLIIMPSRDWGFSFQSDKSPGDGVHWKLVSNLFALGTERGRFNNRLEPVLPVKKNREQTGQITIGRAAYDGMWLPEPGMWDIAGIEIFNRTGIATKTADVELAKLDQFKGPLVHLTGTYAIRLNDAQKNAIKSYIGRGGTILIENVGGRGTFTQRMEEELAPLLGTAANLIGPGSEILNGNRERGGVNAKAVSYRRHAVVRLGLRNRPNLAAFFANNRPAVIVSHEDLSLGAMGVRQDGILGYSRNGARALLNNIVLKTYGNTLK